jgi:hypothetical protein
MSKHDHQAPSTSADDSWGSGPQVESTDSLEDGVQPAGHGGNSPTGLSLGSGSCADCRG